MSYTDEEFIESVNNSGTIAEALRFLGVPPIGGNYNTFKNRATKLGISIKHLRNKTSWVAGLNVNTKSKSKFPIEHYLVRNGPIVKNSKLKRLLIESKMLERKCYNCNRKTWMNKPIPIELEHIDGDNRNNLFNNLTFLCPNCHTFTDTYRGKNIKNKSIKNKCYTCGKIISKYAVLCKPCNAETRINKGTKIVWPSTEELKCMVSDYGYTGTGQALGVSDNAVRKRVKKHMVPVEGFEPPTTGM